MVQICQYILQTRLNVDFKQPYNKNIMVNTHIWTQTTIFMIFFIIYNNTYMTQ